MKFELNGYGLDNILRIMHSKKINIFNLKMHSATQMEFEVEDKNARKVKRLVANVKNKQTPRKIKNYKKYVIANVGVILGVFFGALASIFMSNFTWQIKIFGTKDLSVTEILEVLENNGIKKGKVNTQTSEEIESILINNYDRIAQVSVIKEGTAIIINLSEKLVYKNVEYMPIRATNSGVISKIDVTTGTVNVKVGDFVNKGDVLVLPYNINHNNEKVSVKPMANIEGTMFVVGRAEINKISTVLEPTGRTQTEYKYKIFNIKFFGKNKNSFALFKTSVYNESVSGLIPLTRDVIVYHELKQTEVVNDFNEKKQSLIDESISLAYKNLPQYQHMLNENTTVSQVEDKLIAITTLTVTGVIHD